MNLPVLLRRERANPWPQMTLDGWMSQVVGSFGFNGNQYPILMGGTYGNNPQEEPPNDFASYYGYIQNAARTNSIIYACILARLMHFSEARFQWSRYANGVRGDLFGNPDLAPLENPWPGGQTGDLLARALLDNDLAGNFFCVRNGNELRRLRPDWTTIILGSNQSPETPAYAWDAEILGYYYCPPQAPELEMAFLAQDVAHWAPVKDPRANFRGMSWITSVVPELIADNAMTYHQRKYFEQGATPNIIVALDPSVNIAAYKRWVQIMRENTEGVENAYKTMWLGAGAQPHIVGHNLESFNEVKGHGETRICASAGVPPIVAGASEGLASATYSNYQQALKHFGDSTLRWLWRTFCNSMEPVLTVPAGAHLWYDVRDVAFMREDVKVSAEIAQIEQIMIAALVNNGWEPPSVVEAVTAGGDWSRLKHTGLVSVQLQPPGTTAPPTAPPGEPAPNADRRKVPTTPPVNPGKAQALLTEGSEEDASSSASLNGHS